MHIDIGKAATVWTPLAGTVFVPHTEEEYSQRLVAVLDQLIDEVGEDERHPLASLMEIRTVSDSGLLALSEMFRNALGNGGNKAVILSHRMIWIRERNRKIVVKYCCRLDEADIVFSFIAVCLLNNPSQISRCDYTFGSGFKNTNSGGSVRC